MMFIKKSYILLCLVAADLFIVSCSSEPEPAGPPLDGEITDLSAQFISNLVAEDYEKAASFFNTDMKKAMPTKQLEKAWQNLLTRTGPYQGEIEKKVEAVEDYRAVNTLTAFDGEKMNIRVVFDDDNRVAGLWFLNVD